MKPNSLREAPSAQTTDSRVGEPTRSHRQERTALLVAFLAFVCAYGNTALGQYTAIRVPKGYVQLEGDIITTESDARTLRAEGQGPHPSFVYAPGRLWPGRIVPYSFDADVTTGDRAVFQQAMREWENAFLLGVSTISFQPRNGEEGYLHFVVEELDFVGGKTDYVGYKNDKVTVKVHPNAVGTFLIAHEIGHALGLWHEQSRNDRDSYITVITANILSGYDDQFDKKSPQSTFGDYDYDSIMHYHPCSFSKCDSCSRTDRACRTIEVDAQYSGQQTNIGQLTHLSVMDKRVMAFMYGPPDWKFLDSRAGFPMSGSFQHPYLVLSQAASGVPSGGTLWLSPGTHLAAGVTLSTPMTLRAAIADLQMQPNGTLGPSSSGYATLR